MRQFILLIAFLAFSKASFSDPRVSEDLPSTINANDKFLFYSHGFIVEGTNTNPVHPRWGEYDFPAITTHFLSSSYHLLARHRPSGIAPKRYAAKLAAEIQQLLDNGVPPQHIAVMGFSRGGALSILATDIVANSDINLIVLAGCAGLISQNPDVALRANVLSIYETSDQVGSCEFVRQRQSVESAFTEHAISTGKEHGAFYQPYDAWTRIVKAWLKQQGIMP